MGNWTSRHHWKSIYRASYSPGPTHKNTNNHFVGTLNHCVGLLTSKHYWNTPIRAMFIRSSPSTTQTKSVWAHTNTLWVSSRQITNGKQLMQPRVYHSLLPTTQTTRIRVIWPKITTGKQVSKPHVYQGKTEPLRKKITPLPENQQAQPHCGHTFSITQPFRKFCKTTVNKDHVYKGSPAQNNTHNHCVSTHNHCIHYWKATFSAPCFAGLRRIK